MTTRPELYRPQPYTETSQTYYAQLLTRFRFHLWQLFFFIKKKQNTALPFQPLLFIFRVHGSGRLLYF